MRSDSNGSSEHASDQASGHRREFLKQAGAVALAASGIPLLPSETAAAPVKRLKTPETLAKILYDTFTEKQKKAVCFGWNYVDEDCGLLRTRIENNWKITKPSIKSSFYSAEQQSLIRGIFDGMTDPGWRQRWDQLLKDDVGGFGRRQSIAIFGVTGTDQFEFVLASCHMTLRCDGNSAEHVAFVGPIFYAHEGESLFKSPIIPVTSSGTKRWQPTSCTTCSTANNARRCCQTYLL